MATASRQMRLTEAHVARLLQEIADEGVPEGVTLSTEADQQATAARLLAEEPDIGQVWIFAYGSLIWKPACEFVEIRTGTLEGWHRAFCLGWNTQFRGSAESPGLMLALDDGGYCKGVLYRLPSDAVVPNLIKLLEREMGWKPSAFPPRWVDVETEKGVVRALTFVIDRNSGRYVSGLTNEQIADSLATAVGSRGSMAQYLFSTITHLEQMGIHDPMLWTLQELVAERIEARFGRT